MAIRNRRAQLRHELHELAWSYAQRQLQAAGVRMANEARPEHADLPTQHRQQAYLALLTIYTDMTEEISREVDIATAGALGARANFGEIAEAQRITRQAARQKWRRRTTAVTVKLVGGPRDGLSDHALPDSDIRYNHADPTGERSNITVVYRRKYGDPKVYEFAGYEDDGGSLTQSPPRQNRRRPADAISSNLHASPSKQEQTQPRVRKARVHELAAELGIPTKNVLRDLLTLGVYVKTASSTVEATAARAVRDIYKARRAR